MSSLIGRRAELAALSDALAAARGQVRAVTVTIEGPSGIGKSALLDAFLEGVENDVPVVHLRPSRVERLIDGSISAAIAGHATVLAIDNAHWVDAQSLAALASELAGRNAAPRLIVLVCDEALSALASVDHRRLRLGALHAADAATLAQRHASIASDDAIAAIAQRANGVPFELVTLAWAFEGRAKPYGYVDGSARAAIARFLGGLSPLARAFVQTLSLFDAPVPWNLASALSNAAGELTGSGTLSNLIGHDAKNVSFTHPLAATAVLETIAMKIPLHRRIVAAFERASAGTLYERILFAEQTIASGDSERARRALLDLAFGARETNAYSAIVWASQRHLELGEPLDETFVPFYRQFCEALLRAGDFTRAEAIASHALSEAQRRNLGGLGSIAGQLIQAQWRARRRDAAQASYERYSRAFADPVDVRLLHDAAPWLHAS